ncbi:MAG: hypothetical protein SFW67_33690 [Myxococcaceae bacterium]|nr:hypothetical protein [Myxococcaceae bacterium]
MRSVFSSLFAAAFVACSPLAPEPDAGPVGPTDAGAPQDAGVDAGGLHDAGPDDAGAVDAGPFDAGVADAGVPDAGLVDAGPMVPLAGFGAVTGACGPLSLMDLTSPTPATYETRIDFGAMSLDAGLLTDGGFRLFTTPNAGGSSVNSEVFSFEVLHRCELAELFATETQVTYTPPTSKKTDLVISLEGEIIGVSVARAFKFPPGSPLLVSDARTLLTGKFSDIQVSTQNVNPPYRWRKQILHVLAYDDVARQAVLDAAAQLDAGIRGDTILYLTTTDGNDAFIY